MRRFDFGTALILAAVKWSREEFDGKKIQGTSGQNAARATGCH